MKQQENMIYVRPVRKYTQNRNGSFSTNMILFSGLCQTREKRRKTKEKQESMDDSMQKQKS